MTEIELQAAEEAAVTTPTDPPALAAALRLAVESIEARIELMERRGGWPLDADEYREAAALIEANAEAMIGRVPQPLSDAEEREATTTDPVALSSVLRLAVDGLLGWASFNAAVGTTANDRQREREYRQAAALIEGNLDTLTAAGELLAALRPFAQAAPKVLGFGDTSSAQVIAHMPRVDWERAAALVEALDAGERAGGE